MLSFLQTALSYKPLVAFVNFRHIAIASFNQGLILYHCSCFSEMITKMVQIGIVCFPAHAQLADSSVRMIFRLLTTQFHRLALEFRLHTAGIVFVV